MRGFSLCPGGGVVSSDIGGRSSSGAVLHERSPYTRWFGIGESVNEHTLITGGSGH